MSPTEGLHLDDTSSYTSSTGSTSYFTGPFATIDVLTTFTPPSDCFAPTYTIGPGSNDTTLKPPPGSDSITLSHGFTSSCYPSGAESVLYKTSVDGGFHSQDICLNEFTAVGEDGNPYYTVGYCCPKQWVAFNYAALGDTVYCAFSSGPAVTVINGSQTSTFTAGIKQVVPGFEVFSGSSDALIAPTATPGSNASPGPTPTSPSMPSSSMRDSSNAQISTGTKAGISIGIGATLAGLLAISLLGVFLHLRLYRHKSWSSCDPEMVKAELPGQGIQRQEIGGDGVEEVDGTDRPQETDVDRIFRAELSSNWQGWEVPSHEV